MGSNFLILYTAREGSSAIVDQLSQHPDISVPLFEELDRFWIKKFYGHLDIAQEIEGVFSGNDFTKGDDWGFQNFISGNKRGQGVSSVGFKWRPHGDLGQVANSIAPHEPTIFVLFRRDPVELASSLMISHANSKEGDKQNFHAQFAFSKMTDEQKAKTRKELEQKTYPLAFTYFTITLLKRIVHAIRLRRAARKLAKNKLRVQVLYYEDFLNSPDRFFSELFDAIGVPQVPHDDLASSGIMKKTTRKPAKERIGRFWLVKYNPLIWMLATAYRYLTRF